jgi:Trypsin
VGLFALLVASIFASPAPIIHGDPSPDDPAVVFIRFGDYVCSGTVISPRVVLTAAHCSWRPAGAPGSGGAVHFYERGPQERTDSIPAARSFYHPDYDPNGWEENDPRQFEHDIALYLLDEPTRVRPIPVDDAALGPDDVGR